MLMSMSIFQFFLLWLLNGIPLNTLQFVYLFIYSWEFRLLWVLDILHIKLLWTVVCKSLYVYILLSLLSKWIEMAWLDNMIDDFQIVFQSGCTILHSSSSMWVFHLLHPCQCLVWLIFLTLYSNWYENLQVKILFQSFGSYSVSFPCEF